MWYILGPGSDLTFEIFSRYGLHVKSFQNYDARDLLRLGKDDLVQVGNVLGESEVQGYFRQYVLYSFPFSTVKFYHAHRNWIVV